MPTWTEFHEELLNIRDLDKHVLHKTGMTSVTLGPRPEHTCSYCRSSYNGTHCKSCGAARQK